MRGLIQAVVLLLALCIPVGALLVGLPNLLPSSQPSVSASALADLPFAPRPVPTRSLADATSTRRSNIDAAPPPTLAPPTPEAPEPTPTRIVEQAVIANTGGIGAQLRADPVSGQQIGALREGEHVDVLEHRAVGRSEWLRVRTVAGKEGWVFGPATQVLPEKGPSVAQTPKPAGAGTG